VRGALNPPGSKSLTQRWLLLAALAEGTSVISNALRSDDVEALAGGLRTLGATVRWNDVDAIEVQGVGGRFPRGGLLDAREGGTPARFLMAAAALGSRRSVVDGSARLRRRPMEDGAALLRALGAGSSRIEAGQLPMEVLPGASSVEREVEIARPASSQFLSAVALVAPWLEHGLRVRVKGGVPSASYLELTVRCLAALGVKASWSESSGTLDVRPLPLKGFEVRVEPDASSAAYGWAVASVHPDSEVWVPGLAPDSPQPDMAVRDALVRMGAVDAARTDGCGVRFGTAPRGGEFDAGLWPDGSMALMAVAATAVEPVRISGLGTLAGKESDRIETMRIWLEATGARVERGSDWVRIRGPVSSGEAIEIDPHRDHRVAMSAAVVAAVRGGMTMRDPMCVHKSWPGFWAAWAELLGP
jgi:3-phosphoshikimate 1-carboxyvinyltransferase